MYERVSARRVYSPGRSRRDAAAGPVGVQAEVGDRPRTAGPAPEDSLDTVLGHFGKDLNNHWELTLKRRTLEGGKHQSKASMKKATCARVFSKYTIFLFLTGGWVFVFYASSTCECVRRLSKKVKPGWVEGNNLITWPIRSLRKWWNCLSSSNRGTAQVGDMRVHLSRSMSMIWRGILKLMLFCQWLLFYLPLLPCSCFHTP